jgi:hypothetical protein
MISFTGTSTGPNEATAIDNLNLTPARVPEPATWAMVLFGVGGLGAVLRRRATKLARAGA